MKVLVTGGNGFIGRAVCGALAARGDTLVALLRRPGRVGQLPPGTETVQWNAASESAPAGSFAGVEAVVHLAGESVAGRWTAERKRRIRSSRVLGTRNLIDQLAHLDRQPKVIVAASAIGIYGDRGDETITEDSPTGSGFLAEVCLAWEAEARRAEELDVRVVQLRIGVTLGPDGGVLPRMLPAFKFGLGGPVGTGRQWLSWIHRADVVGLVLHAIDEPAVEGPLNATAPEPVRSKELASILGAVLSRPALLSTPAFVLRLALGEMSEVLLGGQRVLPARAQAIGYAFRFPTLEPALRNILRR